MLSNDSLIKYHEKYGNYNYTFDRDYVLSYKYDMYYNKDKIVDMKDLCDTCKLSSIKLKEIYCFCINIFIISFIIYCKIYIFI